MYIYIHIKYIFHIIYIYYIIYTYTHNIYYILYILYIVKNNQKTTTGKLYLQIDKT